MGLGLRVGMWRLGLQLGRGLGLRSGRSSEFWVNAWELGVTSGLDQEPGPIDPEPRMLGPMQSLSSTA